MYFLHLLLTLVIPMTLSRAQCFHEDLLPEQVSDKGCTWRRKTHAFNTFWHTDDCLRCICYTNLTSCCSTVPIPVDYDQEICLAIYREGRCTYVVRNKINPFKVCKVYGWVL